MCPALQEGRETVLRSTLAAPRRGNASLFLISRLTLAISRACLRGYLGQNYVLRFPYLVADLSASSSEVSVQARKACRALAGAQEGAVSSLSTACLRSSVRFSWGLNLTTTFSWGLNLTTTFSWGLNLTTFSWG